MFARNFIWIANNYSMDEKSLNPQETLGLRNIFMEFIEAFAKDINDEETLSEIVKGLAHLAKNDSTANLKTVSGIEHP